MPSYLGFPYAPEALLAVLVVIPALIAWGLGISGPRPEPMSPFTLGNPLGHHQTHEPHHLVTRPILHLSRTARAVDLRPLALGLKNAPIENSASLLRHFMRSQDPELALFSQSTLQQGRERLQSLFNQLRSHSETQDPRIAASSLETGLRLAAPSLMTPDERNSHLQHLGKMAHEHLTGCPLTPRLLAASVRVFLASGEITHAEETLQKLPPDSLLNLSLTSAVQMAVHCQEIALVS